MISCYGTWQAAHHGRSVSRAKLVTSWAREQRGGKDSGDPQSPFYMIFFKKHCTFIYQFKKVFCKLFMIYFKFFEMINVWYFFVINTKEWLGMQDASMNFHVAEYEKFAHRLHIPCYLCDLYTSWIVSKKSIIWIEYQIKVFLHYAMQYNSLRKNSLRNFN
jgi:hypothetical protein